MDASKIEKMKALALAATKGPWQRSARLNGPFWHISSEHTIGGEPCKSGRQAIAAVHGESKRGAVAYAAMFEANANFIAECNPAAVLELIAEVERLRAVAGRYDWIRKPENGNEAWNMFGSGLAGGNLDSAIDAAIAAHTKAGELA